MMESKTLRFLMIKCSSPKSIMLFLPLQESFYKMIENLALETFVISKARC